MTSSGARAHGRHGQDRFLRAQLRLTRSQERKSRATGLHQAGLMHDVLMREVTVGQEDEVDLELLDQFGQPRFRKNRDIARVFAVRHFHGK